jgi:sugar lactone lactonase YvrE
MRDWAPGISVIPEVILQFPESVRALNGSCLIAPNIILVADSIASLIWRVDLPLDSGKATARVWLKHRSMAYDPDGPMPDQPGINGVQYAPKTNYLYYTSTAQMRFMRVRIDPDTHDPADEPEFVAGGMMGDDFCIDENAGVAYVATHRQNSIDRVALEPSKNSDVRHSVAGNPFTEQLIGPTKGAWGRGAGEYGRVAYFLTDGGTKSPPADGIVRPSTVLRVEFE